MIQCGATMARVGHLNASVVMRMEAKGRVTRLITLPRCGRTDQAQCVQAARFSMSSLTVRYFNISYSRSVCLRKLDSQFTVRLCSSCTTDLKHQSEASEIQNDADTFGKGTLKYAISEKSLLREYKNEDASDNHKKTVHRKHPHKHIEASLSEIEKLYPNPKVKLNNIYQSVQGQLKQENLISMEYIPATKQRHLWTCHYRVKWPETQTITGTGSNKAGAAKLGALKCLQWLHNQGKLTASHDPVVVGKETLKEMINSPTPVVVSEEALENVKNLLKRYKHNVRDRMIGDHWNPEPGLHDVTNLQDVASHPVGHFNEHIWRSPDKIANRNDMLRLCHEKRVDSRTNMAAGNRRELPIAEFRQKIIQAVADNRVVLIKGDTGCGKTTQVPQYIMETYEAAGRGTDCNMIISQPRRISAVSLAERIAEERGEHLGHVVGYQVRLQQHLPSSPGGMLFCTTGIVLRKIQSNPSLQGCSHIILDEAHERSINTDMLLVLLKRALDANPDLKLIIMSATINADLFQAYFNCPAIQVPGRTFPVETNFLEDIERLGIRANREYAGNREFPEVPFIDSTMIAKLVDHIDRRKPPGAILVFLPGWREIVKVKKALEEQRASKRVIVPVHSRMPHRDQRKIFERPPEGIRKIVLATDIAETGITVTDVVYVVDSATQNAMRWHDKMGIACMENQYAAQANILQRKGRAGRVQPGESYHLITRAHFNHLEPDPLPEVLRSALVKTVLDCKTYSSESVESFLGSMPQPPTRSAVRKAIQELEELGALDADENLTALGKRIALFTLQPSLSKALVCSAIFRCLSPMVTVVSAMSAENEIFTGTLFNKTAVRAVKQKYHSASDHLSIHWLYSQWESYRAQGRNATDEFCWKNKLIPERVYTLSKMRNIHAEGLAQCRMIDSSMNFDSTDYEMNEYSYLDELVRGVLLAGVDQLLFRRDFDIRGPKVKRGTSTFIMEDGNRATLTPETVNFKRTRWPSPFLTYVRRQHSEERRTSLIRETSMISPLTVLLFSQGRIQGYRQPGANGSTSDTVIMTIKGRKNFRISCDQEAAKVLLELRDSIWSVVRYLVERQGLVADHGPGTDFHEVMDYKEHMLQVLSKMLADASEKIDQAESTNTETSEGISDDELSE